ncbi:MAG: hypothetical protein ABW060_07365 [Solirubrobacteraceae bacterium]
MTARAAWAVALAGAVLLLAAAPGGVLGYDAMYHLVWGADLVHGRAPDYDVYLAPTPHPLLVLAGTVAALAGAAGDEAMRVFSLIAAGALGAGLCRIGWGLAGPVAGLAAAAVLLLSPPVVELVHEGGADLPALALIVWAAAIELDRPRRAPALVLGLLALAGLLRPEAWLLSLAYLAWLRRFEPRLVALALAAPVLWALIDLVVTGDPLWSVTHTRDGTEILDRDTGLGAALELLPRHVNFLVGPFVLAAAVVGAITLGRRALWVVAPAALIGVGFLFLAVAGLSLQSRYLVGIAAVAALLAGVSLTGRWRWIGAALLVGAAVHAAGDLADTRERLDDDAPALEELVREAPPCAPVHVPTIRPVPFVAFWAGLEPAQVVATPPGPRGSLVTPTGVGESWIGGGGPGNPGRVETAPPDGYAPLSENETWRIYTKC